MRSTLPLASVLLTCLTALSARPGWAATAPVEDELSKYYQSIGHYIVEDRKVQNELTDLPLPFLDWGLVQPGFIAYVNRETREILPLNDAHPLTHPNEVEAVPIATPAGVQIRTQPARQGGTFAEVLFEPSYPWEGDCRVHTLIYDEADQKYKLWYRTRDHYAYAESSDFQTWERPLREHRPYGDRHAQTNLVAVIGARGSEASQSSELGDIRSADEAKPGSSGAFFVDPSAPPDERYKCTFLAHVKPTTVEYARQTGLPLSAMTDPPSTVLFGAVSADGIGWRVLPRPIMLHDADTLTVARYDTLLERYVMYTRLYELGRRSVGLSETRDFARWPLPTNLLSAGPDEPPAVDYYASAFAYYPGRPEIRTMMCLVYDRATDSSQIRLAVSRDGHQFHFVPGEAAIRAPHPGSQESGFISAFPSLVRTPDDRMLVFYDAHPMPHKFPRHRFGGSTQHAAWWPADRLAALEAPEQGEFTTAALTLRGRQIVLNMQAERTGGIQVEMRDEQFRPLPGRSFADADLLYGDQQAATVTWNGNGDVGDQTGRRIYLRFRLRAARLFSIAATSTK